MILTRLFLILEVACLGLMGSLAQAQEASMAATDAAPRPVLVAVPGNLFGRSHKGELSGVMAEAEDIILKRMGRKPTYVTLPNSEIINAVKTGFVDVGAVAVWTQKSGDEVFLSNPIILEYNVLAVRRGEGFQLQSLADLSGKKLGARKGYQYPLLQTESSIQWSLFGSDGENIRALLYGSIDASVIAGISDTYTLRSEGVINKIEILPSAVGVVPLSAAFSSSKFSYLDITMFNRYLAELRASPQWNDILNKNGLADIVFEWPVIPE